MALSIRGLRAVQPSLSYLPKFYAGAADLYDPVSNPDGFIILAVAENRNAAGYASLKRKFNEVRPSSIVDSTATYSSFTGRESLKRSLSQTISRTVFQYKISINPNNLIITSGVGAGIFMLSQLLLDVNDAVLLPTPTYAALYNDICTLGQATIINMQMDEQNPRITRQMLENGYQEALSQGRKVRLLFLMNPNNPFGVVHSYEEMEIALAFVKEKGIHLISDEIYANSCWNDNATFQSTLSHFIDTEKQELPPNVHIMWGFSKDFALSGYRVGAVYTCNKELIQALSNVNYFTLVSNDTQDMLAGVLQQEEFVDDFLEQNRSVLRESYNVVTNCLDEMHIPYVPAVAAMFVMIDLSFLLPPSPSFKDEENLTDEIFEKCKLLFTPGDACKASRPGFYRVCYAWMNKSAVVEGFRRLKKFIDERKAEEI
jgi:aspartate/methionine/tyrosine aminotransferase